MVNEPWLPSEAWEACVEKETATIVGGRWDGLLVEYVGTEAVFQGEHYVSLRNEFGRVFYMPSSMRAEWFVFRP